MRLSFAHVFEGLDTQFFTHVIVHRQPDDFSTTVIQHSCYIQLSITARHQRFISGLTNISYEKCVVIEVGKPVKDVEEDRIKSIKQTSVDISSI